MKFDWKNWNGGGKTIFVAACVAAASMLMNWIDIGIASQSGLAQGTFLLLAFWIYPVVSIFSNKTIHKIWGVVSASASIVFTLGYISSKSITLFGQTVNAAGSGAYLFLLASIALIFGIVKYKPLVTSESKTDLGAGTTL